MSGAVRFGSCPERPSMPDRINTTGFAERSRVLSTSQSLVWFNGLGSICLVGACCCRLRYVSAPLVTSAFIRPRLCGRTTTIRHSDASPPHRNTPVPHRISEPVLDNRHRPWSREGAHSPCSAVTAAGRSSPPGRE
jgi:hypothetical protein